MGAKSNEFNCIEIYIVWALILRRRYSFFINPDTPVKRYSLILQQPETGMYIA